MDIVIDYLPLLLKGTALTIAVAIVSVLISVAMGLLGAWGKLSRNKTANSVANLYTTLIRGVPDLVLMLLLFFGGQQILNNLGEATGLWGYVEINPFTAGVIVIGFIFGAYMTETFRGAYLSIPRGEIEAGIAYGMSKPTLFGRVIWPQLVRYAIPSFTNNWLVLLKTTALVSVLGLNDLVRETFVAGRSTRMLFTFFFVALIIYLILTAVSEFGLKRLEKKYSTGIRRA
ncbi:MAG: ABC transporter permease [Alphaproteobacteria bacterium]